MKTINTIPNAVAVSVVMTLLVGSGCAKVDPKLDYQRSSAFIEKATGVAGVIGKRDAAVIEARVEELLKSELTSNEAVELALLNNAGLLAAFRDIGIARADLVQSGLLTNPTLAMAFRLPAGGGLTAIDMDIAQNIADLWQIPPRERAAERNLELTILRIAHEASRVAAKTKQAYYAVLGEERRLNIARENLEVTRTTLKLSKFRQETGVGNVLDVNMAKGAALKAELAVDRTRLAASEAKRTLAALLGLRIDAERLTLTNEARLLDLPAQNERIVAQAMENRLDIRAMRETVRAADERLVLEHRQVFPSLTVGLSLEREARGRAQDRDILADTARASIAAGRLTAPEIEPRSNGGGDPTVTLGPGFALELPIFDQNQAQIARARYQLEQALLRLNSLQASVVQEVQGAIDQARTAHKIARFYEMEILPQSQQNLDLARESYRAGKAGILFVLEAERAFLIARNAFINAQQEAELTNVKLESAVGVPIDTLRAEKENSERTSTEK